jgi:hypothetical protein|tara:strand:+ start:750 stop:962 length:213 start_codon:yes stop_codon:yes gene_type:complete
MADFECIICEDMGEYRSERTNNMVFCDCGAEEGLFDGLQAFRDNVHGDYDVDDRAGDDHRQNDAGEWNWM